MKNIITMSFEKLHNEFLKLSTTNVSDALDFMKLPGGGLQNLKPYKSELKIFGKAFTVHYTDNIEKERTKAGAYIDRVTNEHVIIVDNNAREDSTVWGDILSRVATQKKIKGTVINGVFRDIDEIRKLDYPIFALGNYMVTGKGRVKLVATNVPLTIQGKNILPNDYIMGDENGVLFIPREHITSVLQTAKEINSLESKIINEVVKNNNTLEEARKIHKYNEYGKN